MSRSPKKACLRCYRPQIAKLDWAVWAASLAGTVLAGAQAGLAISITLALLFVIYESATPNVVQLGKLPGSRVYRCGPSSLRGRRHLHVNMLGGSLQLPHPKFSGHLWASVNAALR